MDGEKGDVPREGPQWPAGVSGQETGVLQGQRGGGTLTGVRVPPHHSTQPAHPSFQVAPKWTALSSALKQGDPQGEFTRTC